MSEYPSYLIHYGIEGQKWGVRRFQNEDGSLTDEGKARYGISEKQAKKLIELEKKDSAAFYKELNKNKAYKNFRKHDKDLKNYIKSSESKERHINAANDYANYLGKKAAKGHELGETLEYGRIDLFEKYMNAATMYMTSDEVRKPIEKIEKEMSSSKQLFEKKGERFIKDLFGKYGDMKLENPNSISINTKTGKVSQQTLSGRALTEMYRDKYGRLR